jgi:hypothetical protein
MALPIIKKSPKSISMSDLLLKMQIRKEFYVKTVGETPAKAAREDYTGSLLNPTTVNRKEVAKKIKELFSYDFDLDPAILTRETRLF